MNPTKLLKNPAFNRRLFWSALIGASLLSLLPASTIDPFNFDISDKLIHAAFYATLGVLVQNAYPKARLIALSLLLCYSLLIECAQYYMPSRSFDWWDFAANGCGIISSWIIYECLKQTKKILGYH